MPRNTQCSANADAQPSRNPAPACRVPVGRGKGSKGLDFFEFLSRCQSEMLAHRDVVLRNHLTELTDHELVATRKSKTGQHTLYYIPLAEEVIRGVILASEKGEDDAAGTP